MTHGFWTIPKIGGGPRRPSFWPPENVIGWPVGENVVLVRTDDVAISVEDLTAFPTGVIMKLVLRARGQGGDREVHDVVDALSPRLRGEGWRPKRLDPSRLRFGVGYPDGSKANNLWADVAPNAQASGGIVLAHLGGESTPRGGFAHLWLQPLPPPGAVRFVCEWPVRGIDFTERTLDGGRLLKAARQAIVLWDSEWPSGPRVRLHRGE